MNRAKILVLCADRRDQDVVKRRLNEVLANPEILLRNSVKDASHDFTKDTFTFALLIVDIHAPLESTSEAGKPWIDGSGGEGGYIFLRKYVLSRSYPPPSILLISRRGDFLSRKEWLYGLQIESVKYAELDIGHFTAEGLDRTFRNFGLSTQLEWPPLFDNRKLETRGASAVQAPDEYVRTTLQSHFLNIYRGADQHDRRQRAWDVVKRIDDSLRRGANRERILANEKVVRAISEWHYQLQMELESGPQESTALPVHWQDQDSRYRAWLHILRADLLWSSQPVDSLYSLMNAIDLNLNAGVEPLGGPGDPAYRTALRLNADQRRWRSGFQAWLERSRLKKVVPAPVKRGKTVEAFDFGYSEKIWHRVLRFQITKATKELRGSPGALLAIENRLAQLSAALAAAGHARAAHELEARACEVRKGRLSWSERFLYWLLGWLCDYGNRPVLLFGWCVLFVFVFAALYFPTPDCLPTPPKPFAIEFKDWPYVATQGLKGVALLGASVKNFVTALYFSVVTFVTLGYGDITPTNAWGKVLAAFEAALGFVMFGLSIAVASTRLRPR